MKKSALSSLSLFIITIFLIHSSAQAVIQLKWQKVATEGITFKKVCVRDDPKNKNKWQVWGLGTNDNVYEFVHDNYKIQPGRLKQISAGGKHLWGTTSRDFVYKWTGKGWRRAGGRIRLLSIGPGGHIWGVNSKKQIYTIIGNRWRGKAGPLLVHISVGPVVGKHEMVWGVDDGGKVYEWNGSKFVKRPGTFNSVFVGVNKQVWGINAVYKVFLWKENVWVPQWPRQRLKKIITAPNDQIYGISPKNVLHQLVNNVWQNLGAKFKDITFKDGKMWGVWQNDQIVAYKKGVWQKTLSGAQDFAVDVDGTIWYEKKEKLVYGTGTPVVITIQEIVPNTTNKNMNFFYKLASKKLKLYEGDGFAKEMSLGGSVWVLSENGKMYQLGAKTKSENTPVVTIGKSRITHIGNTLHPGAWPWISAEKTVNGKIVELSYQQHPGNKIWHAKGLPNFVAIGKARAVDEQKEEVARKAKAKADQAAWEKKKKTATQERKKRSKQRSLAKQQRIATEKERHRMAMEHIKDERIKIEKEETQKENEIKDQEWKKYLTDREALVQKKANVRVQVEKDIAAEIERLEQEADAPLPPDLTNKLAELEKRKENIDVEAEQTIANEKKKLDDELNTKKSNLEKDKENRIKQASENIDNELSKLEKAKDEREVARKKASQQRAAERETKWADEQRKLKKTYDENEARIKKEAAELEQKESAKEKEEEEVFTMKIETSKKTSALMTELMKQQERITNIGVGNTGWLVTAKQYRGTMYYPENNVYYWGRKGLGKYHWRHASGTLKQISIGMHGRNTWGVTPEGGVAVRVY